MLLQRMVEFWNNRTVLPCFEAINDKGRSVPSQVGAMCKKHNFLKLQIRKENSVAHREL